MVCQTCGGQLNPKDKFCRYCGTTVPELQQPVQNEPVYTPNYNPTYTPGGNYAAGGYQAPGAQGTVEQIPAAQPRAPKFAAQKPGGKKPGKKGLLIGAIAAAVLVVVLVVVLIAGGNPAAKVASAFASTGKELGAMTKVVDMSRITGVYEKEELSQTLDLKLDSLNEDLFGSGSGMLNGLGAHLELDSNLKRREIGLRLIPSYGSVELLELSLALEDDMVYFALPQLLPDDAYGLSTVTMMEDLTDMGADVGEAEDISFNIFELIELVQTRMEESEEGRKELEKATSALVKSIEVEKDGKSNVRVNGTSTKCNAYIVTIPQDALEDWLDALESAGTAVDMEAMLEDVWDAMNIPQDMVEELSYELGYYASEPDFEMFYDLVDALGDVELDVFVSKGKVAAVVFEEDLDGSEMELGLYIGGKEEYIDEISLELIVDGEGFTLVSEGDHTAKGGVFTDETRLIADIPGLEGEVFTITTEYNTKSDSDNLTIEADVEGVRILLEGTYAAEKNGIWLDLEDLEVSMGNEKVFSASLSYRVGSYDKRVDMSGARVLSDMTQEDILEIMGQVETKATSWLMDMMGKIPELEALMYMF